MTEEEKRREALRRKRARERIVPENEMQPKHRKSNLKQARKAAKREAKREAKKRKRKKITGFHIISGLLGVAIAVLSFLLLFHIQNIKITGNEYTSSQEVIQWLQPDRISSNSLYVWARQKIIKPEPLPTTTRMSVRMRSPWSIEVTLTEKPVVAGVILNNEYVYFDQDGVVMKKGSDILDGVPMIDDISADQATLYKALDAENAGVFQNLLEVSQYLNKNELVPDKIKFGEGDTINLSFGKVLVQLGTGNYEIKVSQIPPILEKLDGQAGTLELQSYDGTQSTISFKNSKSD